MSSAVHCEDARRSRKNSPLTTTRKKSSRTWPTESATRCKRICSRPRVRTFRISRRHDRRRAKWPCRHAHHRKEKLNKSADEKLGKVLNFGPDGPPEGIAIASPRRWRPGSRTSSPSSNSPTTRRPRSRRLSRRLVRRAASTRTRRAEGTSGRGQGQAQEAGTRP